MIIVYQMIVLVNSEQADRRELASMTYSFEAIQRGFSNNVLRDPSRIVLPMCVLEPCMWI